MVFSNTENQEFTKGDDETEVTITREGNFTESEVHVMEEINIFEGAENRITFQQVYSKTFKCVYELQLYPFDTQVMSDSHLQFVQFYILALHCGVRNKRAGEINNNSCPRDGLHGE